MKTIRTLLWILFTILAAVIIVSFFLPPNVTISRSVVLNCTRARAFEHVNIITKWNLWSPWHYSDSSVRIQYFPITEGNNAGFRWYGPNNKTGSGEVVITNSFPYDSILLNIEFFKKGKMSGNFIFSDTLHKTLVTWKMTANLGKNPLNRYLGLLTDKMAGTDLETGLLNMQYYFDSTPDTIQRPEIVEIDMPLRYVLLVRDTCMADNYNFKQRLLFTELFRMIRNQKLDLDGYPFTIFHSLTGDYIDIEVGIPVHNKFTELSQNSPGIIQQQPYHAVAVKYFGSYSGIAIAYKALEEYLILKKLSVTGPVYEEYVTDPLSVPDTALWQTNVCIPVR